jgi:hypothetical protein
MWGPANDRKKLTTIVATPLYALLFVSIAFGYGAYNSKGDEAAGFMIVSMLSLGLFVLIYQILYFG